MQEATHNGKPDELSIQEYKMHVFRKVRQTEAYRAFDSGEDSMTAIFTRAWVITQIGDDGMATAVRKTSTYYANLDAALRAHGQNFIKWSDDTIEMDVPEGIEAVEEPF